jgi:hypothetical protein
MQRFSEIIGSQRVKISYEVKVKNQAIYRGAEKNLSLIYYSVYSSTAAKVPCKDKKLDLIGGRIAVTALVMNLKQRLWALILDLLQISASASCPVGQK